MDTLAALLSSALGMSHGPCGCGESPGPGTTAVITARRTGRIDRGGTHAADRTLRFELARYRMDAAGIDRAIRDLDGIRLVAARHRQELLRLVEAVQAGDVDTASRIAADIGLTEEALQARGGGLSFLVVFAVAVVLVLAVQTPISTAADPPPPPPPRPLTVDPATAADIDSYLGQ